MTSTVDQKTYLLNKYLKPSSGDKKKRKKKHVKGTGLRIIDDYVDTSRMRPLESGELEALGLEDEDAPQVAGIVDERPAELRTMEEYGVGTKWRVVAQNDGMDSKIRVEEIKSNISKMEDEDNPIFGKMYSDSEDEKKNDSDMSPPRKTDPKLTTKGNVDKSRNKQIHRASERDLSRNRKDSVDSDISPPRKSNDRYKSSRHKSKKDGDISPSRIKTGKKLDLDLSPLRMNSKHTSSELKSRTKQVRHGSDSDLSPPRSKNRKKTDSDLSPPKKDSKHKSSELKSRNKHVHRGSDSDLSPPRSKNPKNSDSDLSPPRKRHGDNLRNERDKESRRNRRRSSDSDISPPRRHEQRSKDRPRKTSRWGHFGPEEKDEKNNATSSKSDRKDDSRRNYDSDLSPPRHKTNLSLARKSTQNRDRSKSPNRSTNRSPERSFSSRNERPGPSRARDDGRGGERGRHEDRRRNNDSPPPSNKKMAKTLEGKTAGLQDARQLKDENAALRRREDEMYSKMSAEASGRDATTVNRRLGKRETSAEREKNRADQVKRKEMEEKYSKWGKGLKQVADQNARVEDYLHEASKPLARHRDDVDLERTLKAQERAGDPMLEYMRGKKKEEFTAPERPIFKGDYPPNRFNIRPGYRWDGVDRSSGYEKKYFDHKSKAKALADEAYKWSSEDL